MKILKRTKEKVDEEIFRRFPVDNEDGENKLEQIKILSSIINSLEDKQRSSENLTNEEQEILNKAKDKLKELQSSNNSQVNQSSNFYLPQSLI